MSNLRFARSTRSILGLALALASALVAPVVSNWKLQCITLEGTLWGADQCSVLVRGARQLVPVHQILVWQGNAG